jgi:ribosomal protein L7/L12
MTNELKLAWATKILSIGLDTFRTESASKLALEILQYEPNTATSNDPWDDLSVLQSELETALSYDGKIPAIKSYRSRIPGMGLRPAKYIIEKAMEHNYPIGHNTAKELYDTWK